MIFLLTVPIVGLICIVASVGIMTDVSRDGWFPLLLYLFVPAVSSVFYTLARYQLIFKDSAEHPDSEGLSLSQKVSGFSLAVFFVSAVIMVLANLPEMADEALLYTKSKNLVFERKEISIVSEKGEKFSVQAMIADTPEKQGIGMMAVSELASNEGMLYVFEKEEIPKFSMSRIRLELEEIVISRNFTVIEVISTEPCPQKKCPVYKGSKPAMYSLEVPRGFSEKNRIIPGNRIILPSILFHK